MKPKLCFKRSVRGLNRGGGWFVALALAALGWAGIVLSAQGADYRPPERMSYQGFLVDNNGAALAPTTPANYTVVFRIYDQANNGTLRWSEQQTVTVDKGNFSVILGEGTAADGDAKHGNLSAAFGENGPSDRYLELTVTINGTALKLLPRLRMLPAPYAFLATQATKLIDGVTGDPVVEFSGTDTTFSKNAIFDGTLRWGAGASLTTSEGGSIELGNSADTTSKPYIDFHYGNASAQGYNMRLINNADGKLTLAGGKFSLGSDFGITKLLLDESQGDGKGLGAGADEFYLHLNNTGSRFAFMSRATGGNELVTIKGSGKVGIGTTDPAAKLSLGTDHSNSKLLVTEGTSGGVGFGSASGQFRMHLNSTSDRFSFLSAPSGTELVTITGSGRVGIGDSSPDVKLSLGSDVGNSKLVIADGSAGGVGLGAAAGQFRMHLNSASDRFSFLSAPSGSELVTITGGGWVGIGTSTPRVPFEVNKDKVIGLNDSPDGFSKDGGFNSGTKLGTVNGGDFDVSILASGWVAGLGMVANSDERIKNVLGASSPKRDLEQIGQLRVVDYRPKDVRYEGASLRKGFLAQEVMKVVPEAVGARIGVIPDIYAMATGFEIDGAGGALKITLPKAHPLEAGQRVQVIVDGRRRIEKVVSVNSPESFTLSGFSESPREVFVYGREVDDFLAVNYDHLFTLGIGAIQELNHQLDEKSLQVERLEKEVSALRRQAAEQARASEALESRLGALEKRLTPSVVPAAFSTPARTRRTP